MSANIKFKGPPEQQNTHLKRLEELIKLFPKDSYEMETNYAEIPQEDGTCPADEPKTTDNLVISRDATPKEDTSDPVIWNLTKLERLIVSPKEDTSDPVIPAVVESTIPQSLKQKTRVTARDWESRPYHDLGSIYKKIGFEMLEELMKLREWLAENRNSSYAAFTKADLWDLKFAVELYYNKLAAPKRFGLVEKRESQTDFQREEYRFTQLFLTDLLLLEMKPYEIEKISLQIIEGKIREGKYPSNLAEEFIKRHITTPPFLIKGESHNLYNGFLEATRRKSSLTPSVTPYSM